MAFSRAAALRSCFRGARPTAARPQLFRHVARRGYASSSHESAKAGGDALWAAGAIAVTVPTCWYLLSNGPDTSHGQGGHGGDHGKSHGEDKSTGKGKVQEKSEEGGEEKEDDKGDDKASEKSDDSDNEGGAKEADTPATSDDEGEEKVQGEEAKDSVDGEDVKDKPATSKPAGSQNTQSGKQEGLSNTDTKHSTDLTNDPDKSKKGEGAPETAKAKGTVNPKRSQPKDK